MKASPSAPRQTKPIQSLQRAITILRSFSEAEPELSVGELSQRLGLHKSTVSRILATLERERLVGRNAESGKYHLGLGMVSLAGVALGRLDIRAVAQPYLNQLVEITQETVNVVVIEGKEGVNIARAASPKSIRYVGWIGRRIPLHCTAPGLVLLAFMAPSESQPFLQEKLRKYTDHTLTSPSELRRRLREIRKQGYAIVHEEFEEGYSGIAAPVHNHQGKTVGAVSITGPTFRLEPGQIEAFIDPLLEITFAISQELGYTGSIVSR